MLGGGPVKLGIRYSDLLIGHLRECWRSILINVADPPITSGPTSLVSVDCGGLA